MQNNDRAAHPHPKLERITLLSLACAMALMGGVSFAEAANHHAGIDNPNVTCNKPGVACVTGSNQNTQGTGVYGTSPYVGVWGFSPKNFGVYGDTNTGIGVEGSSKPGGLPLYAIGHTGNGARVALSLGQSGYSYSDDSGNIVLTGLLYSSGTCRNGCSETRRVVSFGARSAQPSIEDFGEGALHHGAVHVAIDPAFANVMDGAKYLVTLTPEGDADALYVTNRTILGFDVRESRGGHSSIGFTYRILAKPYGARDQRLPLRTEAPFPAAAQ